jgi:fluoride ion exporter CrcB/FEX
MIVWSDIHQCCAKGFCGTHTTFQCPSSTSVTLLCLWLGLVVLGLAILALSFSLGVRATFTMLLL